MRGWTVSAGSAVAVAMLIGGTAAAVTLVEQPAPQQQESPAPVSEPLEPVKVPDPQRVSDAGDPLEPAPEPVAPEPEPAPATEPAPAPEEEPIVTPKPEPTPEPKPDYHAYQGGSPDAPPVDPATENHEEPGGHNQGPVG